jgi:hypothetical protein
MNVKNISYVRYSPQGHWLPKITSALSSNQELLLAWLLLVHILQVLLCGDLFLGFIKLFVNNNAKNNIA